MTRYGSSRSIAAGMGILSLLMAGCVIQSCNWSQAHYERTTSQQAPLGTNTAIDVESRFGAITITGAETDAFDVTATITGNAPTEEEAQELAEETVIRVESVGNTLRIRADTPTLGNNRSVSVSYKIATPARMDVRCESSFGSLDVAGIEGRVTGKSSNGSIRVQDIQGPVNLRTSFGSITCRNIAGQMAELNSGNGSITLTGLKGSVKAETSYGSIACEDFSDGDVFLKSGNGRVSLRHGSAGECNASSSYGSIGCNDLKATTVKFTSGNGSVEIADVQTQTLGVSTSFGSIRARDITAADIMANSANGSIHIACSPACPGDVKAEIKGGYGSIDFAAPPQFAGQVRLSTDFGSVRTALPITMSGEISKKSIHGTIGEGTGAIHLQTSNGSIEFK
jgi:DUF4097 and DUF4098 domain-containing protein YvlB